LSGKVRNNNFYFKLFIEMITFAENNGLTWAFEKLYREL